MSSTVIEPVRRSIGVDCDVQHAWDVFTSGIFRWWPKEWFSLTGDRLRDIVFEGEVGGRVYEVDADGERHHWADVLVWEPPARLVLGWNVASKRDEPTEVEVRFTPFEDGAGTRVELEHRAFERWPDAEQARPGYEDGWATVLAHYADSVALKA